MTRKRTTSDKNDETKETGLWNTFIQILPDFIKPEEETKSAAAPADVKQGLHLNGNSIRIELDECDSATEASDSGAYSTSSAYTDGKGTWKLREGFFFITPVS